jgi:hypothetical protein
MFLLSLLQHAAPLKAQTGSFPEVSGETVVLHCDRELYAAGEKLYYHADYLGPEGFENRDWSTVLYVELISWDGRKHAASKVRIQNCKALGSLRIPGPIASGNYYLRAYTLWMRNYSPDLYTYLPLMILNPYSQEVLAGPAERLDLPVMEHHPDTAGRGIRFTGLQESYKTGELVELELELEEEFRKGSCSLGISKTRGPCSLDYTWEQSVSVLNGPDALSYLPEINGLTLSGKVLDTDKGLGVEGARLQLSSYAEPVLFAELLSGKDGTFIYALPLFTGNPELHIREIADSLPASRLLLASEFCNKAIHLPYVPLVIDSTERSLVKEILVNAQLEERFRDYQAQAEKDRNTGSSFYGSGASVTYVSDYIELADLREFISEIIPQVSIRSSAGSAGILIQGPDCLDIYPPLILLDNIPVSNNEEVLKIPSKRIERIEVLNRAYMVGNTRYSGIFSIYTSNKDMAGFAQNGERHFFNLQMLDHPAGPNINLSAPDGTTLPRISNLLYWEPELAFEENGTLDIGFFAPDTPGHYVITLRSTNPKEGSGVIYTGSLSVK